MYLNIPYRQPGATTARAALTALAAVRLAALATGAALAAAALLGLAGGLGLAGWLCNQTVPECVYVSQRHKFGTVCVISPPLRRPALRRGSSSPRPPPRTVPAAAPLGPCMARIIRRGRDDRQIMTAQMQQ